MAIMNLNYAHTISSLQTTAMEKFKTPFSKFFDKPPVEVTFYNPNKDTTFDPSTFDAYQQIGTDSPYHYDKINHCIIFGFPQIQDLTPNQTDFGYETDKISGTVYLAPNVFHPYESAYFVVDHLDGKKIYFKVTSVGQDTINNKNNWWKLEFEGDLIDANLEPYVTHTYRMYEKDGNFKLISEDDYSTIEELEGLNNDLRTYYLEMFWKKNLQTFVYRYMDRSRGALFYDPYLIEFFRRTKILYNSATKFEWVGHACVKPKSFRIDYDESIFRKIEDREHRIRPAKVYAELITDPMSLMTCRLEKYYCITQRNELGAPMTGAIADPIVRFDPAFIDALMNNKRFGGTDYRYYMNLVLGDYFEEDLDTSWLEALRKLTMIPSRELYYMLPLAIFALQRYIDNLYDDDQEGVTLAERPSVTNISRRLTAVTAPEVDTVAVSRVIDTANL